MTTMRTRRDWLAALCDPNGPFDVQLGAQAGDVLDGAGEAPDGEILAATEATPNALVVQQVRMRLRDDAGTFDVDLQRLVAVMPDGNECEFYRRGRLVAEEADATRCVACGRVLPEDPEARVQVDGGFCHHGCVEE